MVEPLGLFMGTQTRNNQHRATLVSMVKMFAFFKTLKKNILIFLKIISLEIFSKLIFEKLRSIFIFKNCF